MEEGMVGRSRAHLGVLLAGAVLLAACKDLLPERKPKGTAADSVLPPIPAAERPKAAPRPVSASDLENEARGFDQIRRSLRRLVAQEEGFFAENGAYTNDFDRMGFRPEGESAVQFIWINRDGWAASGTHGAVKDKDCVVFVGRAKGPPATKKYRRRPRAGAIVCDAQTTPPPKPPAAPAPSSAARATPPPASADTSNALDAVDPIVVMKVDLRNLVRSQDTYYQTQGIYARRTDPLPLQYLWHKGVQLKILNATRDSWSARATHIARPGTSCVIWYGPVPARPETEVRKRVPDKSAIPACDE
jgi:hypothetical protein